ncbi:hypothetical protein LSAT2_010621 [Lamellibrachia satsuma]|nr:hypothetical protein LSAT2_010621 [Lamellibrachia satsuma]
MLTTGAKSPSGHCGYTMDRTPRTKQIGTHDGAFHCDEALACFMLRKLPEFRDAEVIRTRDQTKLSECDVIVDVGLEYNHDGKKYDHHQRITNLSMVCMTSSGMSLSAADNFSSESVHSGSTLQIAQTVFVPCPEKLGHGVTPTPGLLTRPTPRHRCQQSGSVSCGHGVHGMHATICDCQLLHGCMGRARPDPAVVRDEGLLGMLIKVLDCSWLQHLEDDCSTRNYTGGGIGEVFVPKRRFPPSETAGGYA